jgi:hypothetical protein
MAYSPLLLLHIVAGTVGLLSGAAALVVRKGSHRRVLVGSIFGVAMLVNAFSGVIVSAIGSRPGNVSVGILTFYPVATGWYTIRRRNPVPCLVDKLAFAAASIIGASNIVFAILALRSPAKMFLGYPPGPLIIIAAVAVFAAFGDARMIVTGGCTGISRLVRHLWRMCLALMVAAASIFSRAHLFPTWMRTSGALTILILLPFVLMIFWLIRVKLVAESSLGTR